MMGFLTYRLYLFITLLWVSALLQGTSGNEVDDLDEEESFVRSVVLKMLKEGTFLIKSHKDELDEVKRTLGTLGTKVTNISTIQQNKLDDDILRDLRVEASMNSSRDDLAKLAMHMNVLSLDTFAQLQNITGGLKETTNDINQLFSKTANWTDEKLLINAKLDNLGTKVETAADSVATMAQQLYDLAGRVEGAEMMSRTVEQNLMNISKTFTQDTQTPPSFHPRVAKTALQNTCGGILVEQNDGVLHFEAVSGALHSYTCTWTLRVGTYEKMRLELLYSNFGRFAARLRVTPMWIFKNASLTRSILSNTTVFLGVGNDLTTVLDGPVAFLDLVVVNNGTAAVPPSFRLLFLGEGNRHAYAATIFSHYHYGGGEDESSGVLQLTPYRDHEAVSWVIRPAIGVPKTVSLTRLFMDVEHHSVCKYDFLQLYDIERTERWGHTSADHRNCGRNLSSRGDTLLAPAWIVMFFSDLSGIGEGLEYEFTIE